MCNQRRFARRCRARTCVHSADRVREVPSRLGHTARPAGSTMAPPVYTHTRRARLDQGAKFETAICTYC
eukprot:9392620-Pyramimonas_sp.AAC.1